MKKLLLITLILTSIGCTSETKFGNCVGVFDQKDPKKEYKLSGWNIGLGLFFSEMIIPPILVLTNQTFCPVGNK